MHWIGKEVGANKWPIGKITRFVVQPMAQYDPSLSSNVTLHEDGGSRRIVIRDPIIVWIEEEGEEAAAGN
jgi:hypothetical protein